LINNRDWALFGWAAALFILAMGQRDLRSSVGTVFRSLAHPKLLGPLLLTGIGTFGLVVAAANVGIWESRLLKETIYWFVVAATVLWVNSMKVAEPRFFRSTVISALGATVVLDFYLNLYMFSLPWEIVLFPVLALLGGALAFAETKDEYRPAKRLIEVILTLIGFAALIHVTAELIKHWPEAAQIDTLQELLLPAWLTIGILPLVFAIGLVANYEMAFVRIGFFAKDPRQRLRAKLAILTVCHFRPSRLKAFAGVGMQDVIKAPSVREARRRLRNLVERAEDEPETQ
jgi:hypothetical protein